MPDASGTPHSAGAAPDRAARRAAAPVQKTRRGRARRFLRLLGAAIDPRAWAHMLKVMNYYNYSHVAELRRARLGAGVNVSPTAGFANAENVVIGPHATISADARIWAGRTVRIELGAYAMIGPDVMLTAANYRIHDGAPIDAQAMDEAAITVGRDVWIGRGVTVLPGVTVGEGAVISAGAVVYGDIPAYAIAAGNPARVIGRRRQPGAAAEAGAPAEAAGAGNAAVRALMLRELPGLDAAGLAAPLEAAGIDSFDLITLRTAIEAALGRPVPDAEWAGITRLDDIPALPSIAAAATAPAAGAAAAAPTAPDPATAPATAAPSQTGPASAAPAAAEETGPAQTAPASGPVDPPPPPPEIPEDRFTRTAHELPPGMPASMVETRAPGWLHRRHIMEMPKMALAGMGEPWLFRELGDLHWTLICDFLQSASSQLTDTAGDRLYATITRCKVDFTPSLFHFKENTPLDIRSRLERYGSSVFFSQNRFEGMAGVSGHATVMSTFAKYGERGRNTTLVKGTPHLPDPDAVPPMAEISTFGYEYRARRAEPPWSEVLFECDYEILPPHDINGVGLLYSAAYPAIYDLCLERAEGKGFLMAHSTAGKDLFYFANADPEETLRFRLHDRRERDDGLIEHRCSLSRRSDGARMGEVVSRKRRL